MTTKTLTDWTTDTKIKEALALGFENLQNGEDRVGRSYLSGAGRCTSFRMLKLKEAIFAKESKPKRKRRAA